MDMGNSQYNVNIQSPKQWLKGLTKQNDIWQKLIKIFGLIQALTLVLQAWLFAQLLYLVIIDHKSAHELLLLFIAAGVVIILRYIASWSLSACATRASHNIQQRLRTELIDQLYALGPKWRKTQQSGRLVNQLQEQVAAINGYLSQYLPQMSLVIVIPLFILLAILPLSWVVVLIFLLTAPIIPFVMIILGKKIKNRQDKQQKQLSRMSGYFLDQLRGLTTLQIFNQHNKKKSVISKVAEDFRVRTMQVLRIVFLSSSLLEFFSSVAIALIAVYLGFSFLGYFSFGLYGNSITLVTAFFILLLAPEFYQPLRDLGKYHHAKTEAEAAATQLLSWLNISNSQIKGGKQILCNNLVTLKLKDIDFSYNDGVSLFKKANLVLPSGKITVLMGASGSGKTTVLRLLLGQLTPQGGEIFVGKDPLDNLQINGWRECVSWLSQKPHLIADSLRANLQILSPEATDEEIIYALHIVKLTDWFNKLPDGLNTQLGENGRQLSGGQLRRLGLARVALSKSKILFFDEPTASLDEVLEYQLIRSMDKICKNKTVLLLTHRTAPLQLADRVIKIKNRQFHKVK